MPTNAPSAIASGFLSRHHVLEAATACCAEFGVGGATLRAIAGRLGCAVGSIYRYFPDKGELIAAASEHVLEPVGRDLETGGVALADSVRRYVQQAAAHGDLYRLLMQADGVPPVVERIIDGWRVRLGDRDRARRCWAMVHGLIVLGESESRIVKAVTS